MAWLIRDGQVLASLEVARGSERRLKWLAGASLREGAFLVTGAKAAHSLGSHSAVDVAWLDDQMTVIALSRLRPFSLALPRRRATSVLYASAGAFGRWHLVVGDSLELKE